MIQVSYLVIFGKAIVNFNGFEQIKE